MKIAVVGTCASGKSTVVAALGERGYDAYAVSQEHSVIPDLWNHHAPDLVVLLEADFDVIRRRRGGSWPRWLYDQQRERLRDARSHADLVIDTGRDSVEECIAAIVSIASAR